MKRTTIQMDEALLLEIKQLAEENETTMSEMIREALREYVEAHRKARPPLSFIGASRSGRDDVSSNAEAILSAEAKRETGWE